MRRLTVAALFGLAVACSNGPSAPRVPPSGPPVVPAAGGAVRHFDLVAETGQVSLGPGVTVAAWTYNGTVPGPQLTVTEGDVVEVTLFNRLPEGTTLHWHGMPVANGEDGVSGVTQDAIPPGASAGYRFLASRPGTYWYHSHTNSAGQVDRGLYGALIVLPRGGMGTTTDIALVYDEWPLALQQRPPPPPGDFAWAADTIFTVNGRTGSGIPAQRVKPGRTVRLRLIDAGYFTHYVLLEGVAWRVVALDGHELAGGPETAAAVPVGAGERVDVEFTAPDHGVWLRLLDGLAPAAGVEVPLVPDGLPVPAAPAAAPAGQIVDLFSYPAVAMTSWPAGAAPTRTFTVELSMVASAAPTPSLDFTRYELNGQRFPQTGTLDVNNGDLVEITFVNRTKVDHPMHLHGHPFQVLGVDGKPPAGTLVKDTVLVPAGRRVSIGFRADNPGWWMLHCHELYHSRGGMMLLLRYLGTKRLAQMGDGSVGQPD